MTELKVPTFNPDGTKAPVEISKHPVTKHEANITPAVGVFPFIKSAARVVVLGAEDTFHNIELAAEALLHHEKSAKNNQAILDKVEAKVEDTAKELVGEETKVATKDKIVVNPFENNSDSCLNPLNPPNPGEGA
jgi:hypothetical protein